jgi:hypothetical protein
MGGFIIGVIGLGFILGCVGMVIADMIVTISKHLKTR